MKPRLFAFALTVVTLCGSSAAQDAMPAPIESEKGRFDQPPITISLPRPQYPFEMRRRGVQGHVIVEFTVAVDGSVREAKVIESSQKDFEQSALAAVQKARFKPAMKDGKPVEVRLRVPLYYRLEPPRSR